MPITEAQLDVLGEKLDDLERFLRAMRRLIVNVRTVINMHDGSVIQLTNAQKQTLLNKYDALKAAVAAKWSEMP